MKTKDRVVVATDRITEALRALVRIDYDNEKQTARNVFDAALLLKLAANQLEGA